MPDAVRCAGLVKRYQQGGEAVMALDGVDLVVQRGEFLCLSGPSGSGKTTLLNAIGALDAVDEGTIVVDGEELGRMDRAARARLRLHRLGFVFQAYNLVPVLSALENVAFVMQVQGVPAAARRERAMAILQEVGLAGLESRRPAQLSGGQQQRVAVARALVSEPTLVLADEPTANLDSVSSNNLMALLQRLNDQHGATFIVATHDQQVMAYCKRKISMCDGRIVDDQQTPPDPIAR